jgi:hypothetical protein
MRKDNQEYRWIVCHYTKGMACEPLQMGGKSISVRFLSGCRCATPIIMSEPLALTGSKV